MLETTYDPRAVQLPSCSTLQRLVRILEQLIIYHTSGTGDPCSNTLKTFSRDVNPTGHCSPVLMNLGETKCTAGS
jgi:hypothetical protein